MNKELPKIDLPEEWVIGTGISKELLSLYTNFPCRLKAEIFVLCMEGEIEASVNLNRITIHANEFATLPSTCFQGCNHSFAAFILLFPLIFLLSISSRKF